jgi:hypothetical protein
MLVYANKMEENDSSEWSNEDENDHEGDSDYREDDRGPREHRQPSLDDSSSDEDNIDNTPNNSTQQTAEETRQLKDRVNASGYVPVAETDFEAMNVENIKTYLRAKGWPLDGLKKDLVNKAKRAFRGEVAARRTRRQAAATAQTSTTTQPANNTSLVQIDLDTEYRLISQIECEKDRFDRIKATLLRFQAVHNRRMTAFAINSSTTSSSSTRPSAQTRCLAYFIKSAASLLGGSITHMTMDHRQRKGYFDKLPSDGFIRVLVVTGCLASFTGSFEHKWKNASAVFSASTGVPLDVVISRANYESFVFTLCIRSLNANQGYGSRNTNTVFDDSDTVRTANQYKHFEQLFSTWMKEMYPIIAKGVHLTVDDEQGQSKHLEVKYAESYINNLRKAEGELTHAVAASDFSLVLSLFWRRKIIPQSRQVGDALDLIIDDGADLTDVMTYLDRGYMQIETALEIAERGIIPLGILKENLVKGGIPRAVAIQYDEHGKEKPPAKSIKPNQPFCAASEGKLIGALRASQFLLQENSLVPSNKKNKIRIKVGVITVVDPRGKDLDGRIHKFMLSGDGQVVENMLLNYSRTFVLKEQPIPKGTMALKWDYIPQPQPPPSSSPLLLLKHVLLQSQQQNFRQDTISDLSGAWFALRPSQLGGSSAGDFAKAIIHLFPDKILVLREYVIGNIDQVTATEEFNRLITALKCEEQELLTSDNNDNSDDDESDDGIIYPSNQARELLVAEADKPLRISTNLTTYGLFDDLPDLDPNVFPPLSIEQQCELFSRHVKSTHAASFQATDAIESGRKTEPKILLSLQASRAVLAISRLGMLRSKRNLHLAVTPDATALVRVYAGGQPSQILMCSVEVKTMVSMERVKEFSQYLARYEREDYFVPLLATSDLAKAIMHDALFRVQVLSQAYVCGTHFGMFCVGSKTEFMFACLVEFSRELLLDFHHSLIVSRPVFSCYRIVHSPSPEEISSDKAFVRNVAENMPKQLPDQIKNVAIERLPLLVAVLERLRITRAPISPGTITTEVQHAYSKGKGGVDAWTKFLEAIWRSLGAARTFKSYDAKVAYRFAVVTPLVNSLIMSRMMHVNINECKSVCSCQRSMRKNGYATNDLFDACVMIAQDFVEVHQARMTMFIPTLPPLSNLQTPAPIDQLSQLFDSNPNVIRTAFKSNPTRERNDLENLLEIHKEIWNLSFIDRRRFLGTTAKGKLIRMSNDVLKHELVNWKTEGNKKGHTKCSGKTCEKEVEKLCSMCGIPLCRDCFHKVHSDLSFPLKNCG